MEMDKKGGNSISVIQEIDVQSCSIVNSPESDHSAITLHLKSESLLQPKGPGFLKFNNSLLEDCEYVDKLSEEMQD